MALKDRVRRVLGRSSPESTRTSSTNSSTSTSATNLNLENVLTATPSHLPAITLTKTSSRLSKITTWRAKDKREKWVEPKSKYPGVRNSKHQEMLRGFEMKFGRQGRPSIDGRWSLFSGISPMASRNCSVDEGQSRNTSGLALSRQASRDEGHVDAVVEE